MHFETSASKDDVLHSYDTCEDSKLKWGSYFSQHCESVALSGDFHLQLSPQLGGAGSIHNSSNHDVSEIRTEDW